MEAMSERDQSQDGAIKNTGNQDRVNANNMQTPISVYQQNESDYPLIDNQLL